jgi:hypothetical protein
MPPVQSQNKSAAQGAGSDILQVQSRFKADADADKHQQHEEIGCRPSEQEQGSQGGYPGSACATGPPMSVGIAGRGQASSGCCDVVQKRVV